MPLISKHGKDGMEKSGELSSIRKLSVSGTEHIHYPGLYSYLPEGCEFYARTVLNETEENRQKGIQNLKNIVKKEKLVCPDDNHLIMVLRCCKYNIEKSEAKLKRFLRTRQMMINELSKLNMEVIEKVIDDTIFTILPYRDKNGKTVFYSNPKNYDWQYLGYVGLACMYFSLQFPMTQVYGITYIADNSNLSLAMYYPIMKMFKNVTPMIFDLPLRVQRVDVTNENFLVGWFFTLLRPILPLKIKERLTFHGSNFKDLHNHYNAELVPESVGGKLVLSNKHYKEDFLNFIKTLRAEVL